VTGRQHEPSFAFGEGKDLMEGKRKMDFCIEEEAQHLLRSRRKGERHREDGRAYRLFQMRAFFSQERKIL
jgi:hypothetical protein